MTETDIGIGHEVRYELRYCMIVGKDVWTIRARQPDGKWKVAGCVDQDDACRGWPCAFTMPGGAWPFTGAVRTASPYDAHHTAGLLTTEAGRGCELP